MSQGTRKDPVEPLREARNAAQNCSLEAAANNDRSRASAFYDLASQINRLLGLATKLRDET